MTRIYVIIVSLCFVMMVPLFAFSSDLPKFEKCLQWKKQCAKNEVCLSRQKTGKDCYYCVKPGTKGFHVYPSQIERQTCHLNTVHDLRNMGYNCYHDQQTNPCVEQGEKTVCDSICVKYAIAPME